MRLRIGEFAKVGMVSVSALRFYSDEGLLKPADVDRWTGYRYYSLDQLPALNRILALKDMGLSLEQIRQLMGEELPAEQIRGMLRLKRAELQTQAHELDEKLIRVESRLQQIEMEGKMSDYDVIIKKVDPIKGAILDDVVPNMEETNVTFNRLFDEAMSYVQAQGGVVSSPPLDLWYDDPEEQPQNMRVSVVVPLRNTIPESSRIKMGELPGAERMSSLIHRGSFAGLGQAYGALVGWIQKNGYRITGPNREIYLEYERDGDPSKWVTEIQYPVEK